MAESAPPWRKCLPRKGKHSASMIRPRRHEQALDGTSVAGEVLRTVFDGGSRIAARGGDVGLIHQRSYHEDWDCWGFDLRKERDGTTS